MPKNYSSLKSSILLALCAGAAWAASVPAPKVTPIPVTATSYPLATIGKTLAPVDLTKAGYVEEEFVISGNANVYDWLPDGSLSVKTPNAPYATRILVRRPSKSNRSSGTAVVEIMTGARRMDWAMAFGYLRDQIIERGDTWVGVSTPGLVAGLKKFNPERYSTLSFANPAPGGACPGAGKNGPSDQEDGLRWDMFSQVAAALKSNAASGPAPGMKIQYVYMTSGLQAGDLVTYINAVHSHATLENGKPAYDGYLIKNAGGAGKISQCAVAFIKDDPRQKLANVNVPVINVVAEGEVLASLAARKPDSDDPAGRYRHYEVAGAVHIDSDAFYTLPVLADQVAAVGAAQGTAEWPLNAQCEPKIPLMGYPLMRYALDGALAGLDTWARKGVAPPKAGFIDVKEGATPSLATNEFGALGGVRSFYVDVPAAAYFTGSPGPGTCRELGRVAPFDAARIQTLYGDRKKYAAKATEAVNKGVKERFFTEFDGKKMKAEIQAGSSAGSGSN